MVLGHLYFALHFAWCSWPCILWDSIVPQFCDGSVTLWNLLCYAVDLWYSLELLLSVLYQCTMFCDPTTSFFSSNSNIASTWPPGNGIPKLVQVTSWLFEPKFSPFRFVDTVGKNLQWSHAWAIWQNAGLFQLGKRQCWFFFLLQITIQSNTHTHSIKKYVCNPLLWACSRDRAGCSWVILRLMVWGSWDWWLIWD